MLLAALLLAEMFKAGRCIRRHYLREQLPCLRWPAKTPLQLCLQALREQDLIAIADAGDPIRYSPGELVALAHTGAAATAFYLVTAGEVMLLPASLQIPPGTAQLDVAKVCACCQQGSWDCRILHF